MRRLGFLAAASLGLGVAVIVDQPASFAHCSDAECTRACKKLNWESANNWVRKYNTRGGLGSSGKDSHGTDHPKFCERVCKFRHGHPQDKYNRENKKSNCDQYLANKEKNKRCRRSCDNPTKEYYQMSDKEKKQWVACNDECDKKFPLPERYGEERDCGRY